MIALSTLTTSYKILRTGKPEFLRCKFVRNERNTAFIQQNKIGIAKEGFVYRAIVLLNKIGDEILNASSEQIFKAKARKWVKNNISVKPDKGFKSMRLGDDVNKSLDRTIIKLL